MAAVLPLPNPTIFPLCDANELVSGSHEMHPANLEPFNAALIEAIINRCEYREEPRPFLPRMIFHKPIASQTEEKGFSGKIIEVVGRENILESAYNPRTRTYIVGTFPYEEKG